MNSPHDTINDNIQELTQLKSENYKLTILAYAFLVLFGLTLILAIKQQGKIMELKAEKCHLKGYKQAWIDFNKSFIPSTALPRCPEIEAIYKERK